MEMRDDTSESRKPNVEGNPKSEIHNRLPNGPPRFGVRQSSAAFSTTT
jgi:hypothetical protein